MHWGQSSVHNRGRVEPSALLRTRSPKHVLQKSSKNALPGGERPPRRDNRLHLTQDR